MATKKELRQIYEDHLYEKNGEFILIEDKNLFVYEVSVYIYRKNYFSMSNTELYSSPKEILNIISSFWKNKHTEICCERYSAPLWWLQENDYKPYVKPVKIKRIKKDGK